jgi:putative redox protein
MEREVVVRTVAGGTYRNEISAGPHRWTADGGTDIGGDDAAPAPFDLLLAALGACTTMTVTMYAGRKGWDLRSVEVRLTRDPGKGIRRVIRFEGSLDAEQRKRLLEVADKCPVHKALVGGTPVATEPA